MLLDQDPDFEITAAAAAVAAAASLQLCLTLIDRMDCSLRGSSIHGIFQARVLEWGAIAFSISFARLVNLGIYLYFYK